MYIWTTPDSLPTGYDRWVFYLPSDVEWLAQFMGAFSLLFALENFQQGGVTPLDETQVWIEAYMNGFVDNQVGQVRWGAWSVLPDNMLPCDGSDFLRVDYPVLYDAIDPVFHVDSDTFKTPDLRGRTQIGTGIGVGLSNRVIGDVGGQETVVLTEAQMPSHNHSTHTYTTNIDLEGVGVPDPLSVGLPELPDTTGNRGNDEPHENMQPYLTLIAGIVFK